MEELGSLSRLNELSIYRLENISSSAFAKKIRLSEKDHLHYLHLCCTSRYGHGGLLLKEDKNIYNKGQREVEEVFDALCPPPCLETLVIKEYFGRRLPGWLMSATGKSVESLRLLELEYLPCCTELPDDLCQLPSLEVLRIKNAPAIKHIGPEFLQPVHHHEHLSAAKSLGPAVKLIVRECLSLERISNLPKNGIFQSSGVQS